MTLDTAEKQKLIESHQVHATDTGSVEVQVAMLSERISKLSDHLQGNIHDYASRQGLLKMIGKRKRLLSYIKGKNPKNYQDLIKKIGIRGWFLLMKKKQAKKRNWRWRFSLGVDKKWLQKWVETELLRSSCRRFSEWYWINF